ncbi:ComEC/Rec2 family competence protein [Flavobacterium hiemivividum]|uniref:ComEC family competence protein n=1 Tax=Flavobacterium hiemivividum TaxID=2541734 RepID=A0A4R5CQT3_9FLAO|nr:ComEC/Rec2 family competence protein [Flavobacterium hiemivividum]TDE02879.1 ComEC family competence protein [Flavobacterium hiemivividum]
MKVLQFPLSRITIGFVLGILTASYLKPAPSLLLGLLAAAFLLFATAYFLQKNILKNTITFGISTYLLSFLIGATTLVTHTESYQKTNYTHHTTIFEKPQFLSLVIREKLKGSNSNDRYIALINKIGTKNYTGRILLNIRRDSVYPTFVTGNLLHITGVLYKNKIPNNPNQFDYGAYLSKKQIYAQLYPDSELIRISPELKKDIWYYASNIRSTIIANLEKSGFHKKELSVAIALILGQKQDISPEIIQSYQFAGAIHILSVSGLHVGFLLLFLTFILRPIPNTKRGTLIKLIIILLSLASFAVIAGLAPSVVRSVTMFSFVAIGYQLRRSVNIYHTLLVSVLLILVFQPSFLFDVGFQLSYIALFSIVWLQPLLVSIWTPKNKAINYFWKILTVSFAAQIGTMPLSIYYFHQFPGLFFITNLLVIPLLSFIMILGVLVMVLAAFDYVPILLSKPLEWSIYFLNNIINSVASFEQFIIRDIPFNIYLLLSSYLFIIAAIVWLKKPSFNKLAIVLVSIIAIQVSFMHIRWNVQSQQEWVVFNLKNNTMITERNGNKTALYADDSIRKNSRENTVLKSYLTANFSALSAKEKIKNTAFFKENRILIIDSTGMYSEEIRPDIILIIQSPKINLERMLELLKPKMVVADNSNYKNIQKHWRESCEKQKIPFHAIGEKGFFKLN